MCIAVSLALSSCTSRRLHGTARPSAPLPVAVSSKTADELWTKSVRAAHTVPLGAKATVTTWPKSGDPRTTVFHLLEGSAGQYRLDYAGENGSPGRVVLSDGHTIWQYEPREKTVVRRKAPADHRSLDDKVSDDWKREIGPGVELIDGRPASILVVKGRTGAVVERRWIDQATDRAIRVEEYDSQGRIQRRMTLSNLVVRPKVSAHDFQPEFGPHARSLTASAEHPENLEEQARRLGLPVRAGSMQLRSVVRPSGLTQSTARHRAQCLYSDGPKSISVFVAETDADGRNILVAATGKWHKVRLAGTAAATAREDDDGHAAVSWIRADNHYTAVARMPVSELVSAVQNLTQ